MEENIAGNNGGNKNESQRQIAGAIIIAGLMIAGAILVKGNNNTSVTPTNNNTNAVKTSVAPAPVTQNDRTIGNPNAKVTFIIYEDFQCPFCGAVSGLAPNSEAIKYLQQKDATWAPFMPYINDLVKNGSVKFVYRDWAFLGPESIQSAEAARCAGDQGKFWEYHDYLYAHQNGENKGGFSNPNLKSFAKTLGLNTATFNQCLDASKYAQAISDSKAEGQKAGVTGTPKGFILVNGKVLDTIDGAEPLSAVKQKLDAALK